MGNSIEINNLTPIASSVDVEVNGNLEGTFAAGSTIDVQITDGTNPVTPDDITVVGNTVTIEVPAGGGGAPVGATLMRTGQTTSYRTGDDGDLQAGRAVDFFTLASNNPFGNTNRFTDELGGQTYTNNIVIDWSTYDGATVLGYRRTNNGSDIAWNQAIDGALLVSIGSFTSGWRLPNRKELDNIVNIQTVSPHRALNYAPFNLNGSNYYWSSSTQTGSSNRYTLFNDNCNIQAFGSFNSSTFRYIPCRTFTVTGTTLT
jgi:hypothetical protein